MKRIAFLMIFISLFKLVAVADEGMWIPLLINQLNIKTMQGMGCKLTAEQIYSINQACLKDAIVSLDHGSCTGEMISQEGLLLTNHHCGFGEIQNHSSPEHDYLTNGFIAKNRSEELPNEGKVVSYLIRIEDVTDKVLAVVKEKMSEQQRQGKIDEISNEITKNAISNTHFEASVESFYKGNNYYLFVYETYRDVRLVFAPPSAIGKFGGDTDNWMWPRHTGDFSIFRVYTGPDGKPADYSAQNIPMHPKYSLTISTKALNKGDFTMVFGYPGSTDRYLTSWGVENEMNNVNDIRVKVRTKKLEILKEDMNTSDKLRIMYADKYSTSSNYWKYSIGQNKRLRDLQVKSKKQELESVFTQWIGTDSTKMANYGESLKLLKRYFTEGNEYAKTMNYWVEAIYSGPEIIRFTMKTRKLLGQIKNNTDNQNEINAAIAEFKNEAQQFYKEYNPPTDKKVLAALLSMYRENVLPEYYPDLFNDINKNYAGDFSMYVNDLFAKSVIADSAKLFSLLVHPNHEFVFNTNKILALAGAMEPLENLLRNKVEFQQTIFETLSELKENAVFYFKNFDPATGKEQFVKSLTDFYKDMPKNLRPDIFIFIDKKYKGNIQKYADYVFSKSILTDSARFNKFVASQDYKILEKDPAFVAMKSFNKVMKTKILESDLAYTLALSALEVYWRISEKTEVLKTYQSKGERLFMAGLMDMQKDKTFYPDANSTLRMTYGQVGDYEPMDAVYYKHYTTIKGYIEKEDPKNDEFTVPAKLKELYEKKDFGDYAQDGTIYTCFITNNDITGGNSGSPVLNANGELIGIAFDGNWEAMSGDIAYEPKIQKTICVDIRFVLWIIDKMGGATNLINEMKIVK